jgi:hypothetical protein
LTGPSHLKCGLRNPPESHGKVVISRLSSYTPCETKVWVALFSESASERPIHVKVTNHAEHDMQSL